MRVAPHCQPDGWRYKYLPHVPVSAWPEDFYVQWGGGYKGEDCFFEVLTPDYMHVKAPTVAEAELKAFEIYQRHQACPGHEYEARGYTSGCGFCKHCGVFAIDVIPMTEEWIALEKETNRRGEEMLAKWKAEEEAYEAEHGPITEEQLTQAIGEVIIALAEKADTYE